VRRRAAEACLSLRSCFLIAVAAHGVDTRSALLPSPKAHARHTNKETHLKPPGMRSSLDALFHQQTFYLLSQAQTIWKPSKLQHLHFLIHLLSNIWKLDAHASLLKIAFIIKGHWKHSKSRAEVWRVVCWSQTLLNKINRQLILITCYPS
jgi:hypothetical protein